MSNFSKGLVFILAIICLQITFKCVDIGYSAVLANRLTLTNRQGSRNVLVLRQERAEAVSDLERQVDALRSRLNVIESTKAPCDLMGFVFKQED